MFPYNIVRFNSLGTFQLSRYVLSLLKIIEISLCGNYACVVLSLLKLLRIKEILIVKQL